MAGPKTIHSSHKIITFYFFIFKQLQEQNLNPQSHGYECVKYINFCQMNAYIYTLIDGNQMTGYVCFIKDFPS